MLITRGLGKIAEGTGTVKVPEYIYVEDPNVIYTLSNTSINSIKESKPNMIATTTVLQPIIEFDINLSTLNINITQLKPHIKGTL